MTPKTLRVLGAEHGVLVSITRLLEAEALRAGRGETPNLPLVASIVEYLRDYPCQFHHPKEERFLFPALKAHGGEGAEAIARLESEHAAEDALIHALDLAARDLGVARGAGSEPLANFAEAARAYSLFLEQHVREEENHVFPLALRTLSADEWAHLDRTFGAHADPLLQGEHDHFRQLRVHIAALGAPPFGM